MTDGITYKQVIDLGFDRYDQHDPVFFDDNGYNWFLVTMKLAKRVELDWDCQTHEVKMYRYDRDGSVKGMIPLKDIESVKEMIDFYGKGKEIEKEKDSDYCIQKAREKYLNYANSLK